jgi:hypothetical protein
LITFGLKKGWVQCHLRTSAPHAYLEEQISTFDFSDITSPATFEINAKFNVSNSRGEYYYYPQLWIDLRGDSTGVTITNNSDGGRVFQIQVENTLEEFYFNNQLKQIISSTGLNRLQNFNKNWLRLTAGNNILTVDMPCILQFRCQYPVYI